MDHRRDSSQDAAPGTICRLALPRAGTCAGCRCSGLNRFCECGPTTLPGAEAPSFRAQQKTLSTLREGLRTGWRNLCGAHDIPRLESLRAFQQIELYGLAFIQRTITVLLDGRKMHEDIFAGGALDESISLRSVEPLHSTLLSHKKTPFALSLRIILPSSVCFDESPCLDRTMRQSTPSKDGKNFGLHRRARVGHCSIRKCSNRKCANRKSPSAFPRTISRDEILWSCKDEGAMSHC